MIINRRIKLKDYNYFISYECEYNTRDDIYLDFKNYKDKYYDGGDLTLLIEAIEKNYNKDTYKKYSDRTWLMSDALYIYDNIPFISGVGYYIMSSKDGSIVSTTYMSKEELDKYIKDNNVKMTDNSGFKLYDQRTWKLK